MAKRTLSQSIGSRGQRLAAYLVEAAGGWIVRAQEEDFGIDLEAELSNPEAQGELLKIQVKTSAHIVLKGGHVPAKLSRSFLRYAETCRIPVILVQVDLKRKAAWYLWLQKWILEQRRTGNSIDGFPKTLTLHIPKDSTLQDGLRRDLKTIARWETEEQLLIAMNDCLRTAASLHRIDILNPLLKVLANARALSDKFPIDVVIDQAIALDSHLWATPQGNAASLSLFAVCRVLGGQFTADQIAKMVLRKDSYSRVGVNALGILYDEHPKHIAGLGLPAHFKRLNAPLVGYYSSLRERYSGKPIDRLLQEDSDLVIDGLTVHPRLFAEFLSKWPNRGDSVILDYVIELDRAQ